MVETSQVGTIFNGLSHLPGCRNKSEFTVALLRGLGGNIASEENRSQFAKKLFDIADERLPDATRPLDTFYNPGFHFISSLD